MFFAVGIVVFLLYGFTSSASAGMDPLYLPAELWGSTLVLILTSWVMYSMERAARQGAYDAMERWMHRTWGLSLLFVLIQVPALSELLRVHFVYVDSGRAGVYGITFALILLHALHVVGGMIAMGILFLEDTRWRPGRIACSSGANVCPILAFSFWAMGCAHGRISHGWLVSYLKIYSPRCRSCCL